MFLLAIGFSSSTAVAVTEAPTHPVKVTTCNPKLNYVEYPGYVPAFYPGGPWYWNDVYGSRYYQPREATTNPTLGIDYVNVTQQTMKQIEFGLLARGTLIAEVRDVGTFSPNVEIKHQFGLNPNVFPIGTGLPKCVPLRITFEDGTVWKNPHLPAIQRSAYEGHP